MPDLPRSEALRHPASRRAACTIATDAGVDRNESGSGIPVSRSIDKARDLSYRSGVRSLRADRPSATEGIQDFELGLAFTMRPSDKRRADFVKLARLDVSGVSRTDDPDRAEAALIGHVELEVPSGFSLRSCEPGDDIYFPDPLVATDGKERNSIRFIHVGGQMEVFINERRVSLPADSPRRAARRITFQLVGTSVDVTSSHWTN